MGRDYTCNSSRSCEQLPEPKHGSGECDDGEVVSGGFLEALRDTSEVFELAEAAFDEVALGIEIPVEGMPLAAGRVVGHDGERALVGDNLAEVVGFGHHHLSFTALSPLGGSASPVYTVIATD